MTTKRNTHTHTLAQNTSLNFFVWLVLFFLLLLRSHAHILHPLLLQHLFLHLLRRRRKKNSPHWWTRTWKQLRAVHVFLFYSFLCLFYFFIVHCECKAQPCLFCLVLCNSTLLTFLLLLLWELIDSKMDHIEPIVIGRCIKARHTAYTSLRQATLN